MAKPREHLSRAPIAEALIDIRVLPREGIAADVFIPLKNNLANIYPKSSPMRSIEARFQLDQGKVSAENTVQSNVGWLFEAQGRKSVAQFRVDGFTYNKLEPYTTWEEVFSEAYRLWRLYIESAKPLDVTRLAVRYINRLRLPAPVQLSKYLAAPPVLPPPIPQTIREFLTRVVVFESEHNSSAIITQAVEAALDPTQTPVLLDIDAFREATIAPEDPCPGPDRCRTLTLTIPKLLGRPFPKYELLTNSGGETGVNASGFALLAERQYLLRYTHAPI